MSCVVQNPCKQVLEDENKDIRYQETIDWIFRRLPVYQNQGAKNYKLDLSKTKAFAKYLGNPERNFKSIHIGGTNGKGSTSHMIASVLLEEGYRVGLYTSPHLKDFRERIRIGKDYIPEAFVIKFVAAHSNFIVQNQLSFFELTVGMAFDYFSRSELDLAVIEVGLGGRLDSTNILMPELAVITNISKDHTYFLGNTLAAIATEKAGIIKAHTACVIGRTTKATRAVFEQTANKMPGSKLFFAQDDPQVTYQTDLQGNYQKENCQTACCAIRVLQEKAWKVSEQSLQQGLANVIKNTNLLGRWQVLQQTPRVVCDTAHNIEGIQIVLAQVLNQEFDTLHIVLGFVKDKDLATLLPIFPKAARYYFVKPNIQRGMSASYLAEKAKAYGLYGTVFSSVSTAYKQALRRATPEDFVFIGGSTFVVAEVL